MASRGSYLNYFPLLTGRMVLSKDNIREAIGEIQLHTIVNVLKNWPAEAAI